MVGQLERKVTDYVQKAQSIGWLAVTEILDENSAQVEAFDPNDPSYAVIITWIYNPDTGRVNFVQSRRVQRVHDRTFKNANEAFKYMEHLAPKGKARRRGAAA